ncbi:cell wall-binding repeat-containing protein [Clostridium tetanomorphum]|uniref:cell wall-binding repeat-containing protein n=1 Tax=Clostridium tetanomorphum TaxID=1553 RepID=UPI001FA89543|nr:cell wall-binding repeat-containing protein [Clostridium tetanomorphum]
MSDKALSGLTNVERLSGNDRFETNKNVLERFKSDINFENVYVVQGAGPKGNEFADALSCSALAAQKGSPMVLTYKNINEGLEKFITNNLTSLSSVTAIGGEAVVPSSILDKLQPTNIEIIEISKKDTVYGDEKNIKTINGDLLVNADNVTLQNLDVKGVLTVNPGENGSTNIKNMTANTILIKSGAKNSIHISKVKAKSLIVDSKSEVRVEIKDNTDIDNTEVKTASILENISGNFGNVTVSNESVNNGEKIIQFKGNFSEIKIAKEGKIKILKDSKVEKIIANAKCNIDIESGATVNKVEKGNYDVSINGNVKEIVNSNTSIGGGGGGSSSVGSGEFKLIVSEDNGKYTKLEKTLKVEKDKNALDYLKSVAKVTEKQGSGFINGIDGVLNKTLKELTEDQRQKGIFGVDWFIYLNGKKTVTGAKGVYPESGDTLKFDYHEWDWHELAPKEKEMPIKLSALPSSVKAGETFKVKATCISKPVYNAIVKVDGKEVGKTDTDGCVNVKIASTGKHTIRVEKEGGSDEKTIEVNNSGGSNGGSSGGNTEEDLNVEITENNKVYGEENKTKTIGGNVSIKANNVTLRNVDIKGTLTIDAGIDGTANIKNVTATVIEVKSGDINSIHLINTKSEELIVNSRSHVRVQLNDDSKITTTRVKTTSILDEVKGTFGNIIIENSSNGNTEKREVEFRGNFDKPVLVKGEAKLLCTGSVEKISLAPETKSEIDIKGNVKSLEVVKEAKVNLTGDISEVRVFKEATINVDKDSKVNMIASVVKAEINVEEGAEVAKVQVGTENPEDVKINGKVKEIEKIKGDDIKPGEDPEENPNTKPEDKELFTIMVSKDNGSTVVINKKLKVENDKNGLEYLKSVANVTESNGFISAINGISNKTIKDLTEDQRKGGIFGVDWYIYLNENLTPTGITGVYPKAGDTLTFDYHEWDWKALVDPDYTGGMPIKLSGVPSTIEEGQSIKIKATCVYQPVYNAVVKVDGVEVGRTDMNGFLTIKITSAGSHKISVEKENGIDEKTINVNGNTNPGGDTGGDNGGSTGGDTGNNGGETKPEKPSDDKFEVTQNGDKVQIKIKNKENGEVAITLYDSNNSLVYIGQGVLKDSLVQFNTVLDNGKYYGFYKFKNGEKIKVEFEIK